MRNLLEFLAKHNHWIVFVILEALSFMLLFRYNSYQNSVWFSSANAVTGKVYNWSSQLESYFSLTAVNENLTQRNLTLEKEVAALTEKLADVSKDSTKLVNDLTKSYPDLHMISAKVISNSLNRPDNLITINKGSNQGIKKDMGVVCGTGVVGIVYLVSANYSVVIPLLNAKSNISCKILNRQYFGYLHWTGGASDQAFLDDIPRHARFKLNEKIVTSGYSSVFPSGILVGKIKHVYNSVDGLSYRLSVTLSTDFGTLRDIAVIDNTPLKEQIDLMRAAKDSMQVK
ncbi:MAG: rod shape-determining protein MreC [Prevotella sp.]